MRSTALAALLLAFAARAAGDDLSLAAERYVAARRAGDLEAMRREAETIAARGEEAREPLEGRLAAAAALHDEGLAPWTADETLERARRIRAEFVRGLRSYVRNDRLLPDEGASDVAIGRAVRRARLAVAMATATDTAAYLEADPGLEAAANEVEALVELLVRLPGTRSIPGPDLEARRRAAVRPIDPVAADPATDAARRKARAVEDANDEADLAESERGLLAAVNEYRASAGLGKLAHEPRLAAAARSHATEMGEMGYFGHRSPTPGRKKPVERVAAAGYPWASVGEVLARGDHPPPAILEAWWASPGHHRALLMEDATEAGIARVADFWVLVLARPRRH